MSSINGWPQICIIIKQGTTALHEKVAPYPKLANLACLVLLQHSYGNVADFTLPQPHTSLISKPIAWLTSRLLAALLSTRTLKLHYQPEHFSYTRCIIINQNTEIDQFDTLCEKQTCGSWLPTEWSDTVHVHSYVHTVATMHFLHVLMQVLKLSSSGLTYFAPIFPMSYRQ